LVRFLFIYLEIQTNPLKLAPGLIKPETLRGAHSKVLINTTRSTKVSLIGIYCFIDKSTIPFNILHYFILFMHTIHINFYYCNPCFNRLFRWKTKSTFHG